MRSAIAMPRYPDADSLTAAWIAPKTRAPRGFSDPEVRFATRGKALRFTRLCLSVPAPAGTEEGAILSNGN